MFVNVVNALLAPSRSVTSYKSYWLSPDLVETTFAVAAMFALRSGSTIIFMLAAKGDVLCPFAKLKEVVYVTVVPAFCCPDDKLNVFEIVLLVSPLAFDPTLTF